jgi:hypothetical protein
MISIKKMTLDKFIEENFDMYQRDKDWGAHSTYFSPKTDIGWMCVEDVELEGTTEDGVPLFGGVYGIVDVLEKFYGLSLYRWDVIKCIQGYDNKTRFFRVIRQNNKTRFFWLKRFFRLKI